MCRKIYEVYQKHEIKFGKEIIISAICALALVLVVAGINTAKRKPADEEYVETDENVYLNEEICYAKGIYIKASSISVTSDENQTNLKDEDADELSKYTLNIGLSIERRIDTKKTKEVEFSPASFCLKNVNLEAKTTMSVFLESLAKETMSLILGMATGSINLIDETVNLVAEYTEESIENAKFKTDFKKIKCPKECFESFKLDEMNKIYKIDLHFPIKKEYTESKNVIVLSIDHWNHIEKKIFLITNPKLTKEAGST